MDQIISQLALNTVSFVGKAAFGAASSMAVKHVSTYIQSTATKHRRTVEESKKLAELEKLAAKFKHKTTIINQIVDLIEIAGARGNSLSTSMYPVTNDLKRVITDFSEGLVELENANDVNVLSRQLAGTFLRSSSSSKDLQSSQNIDKLKVDMLCEKLGVLIEELDQQIPYLQLVLTATGLSFSSNLSSEISVTRLLRASKFLEHSSRLPVIVEKSKETVWTAVMVPLRIKCYSLFFGSIRAKSNVQWTWKEEFPLASLVLERKNIAQISYRIRVDRDTADGLFQDEDDSKDIIIDLVSVKKLFYSNAGRLLKIEDSDMPCLIVKCEEGDAALENRKHETSEHTNGANVPGTPTPNNQHKLKRENPSTPISALSKQKWFAFELYNSVSAEESSDCDDASDKTNDIDDTEDAPLLNHRQTGRNENLPLHESSLDLSDFEYMIKLAALEIYKQEPHINLPDELICEFLRSDEISKTAEEAIAMPKSFSQRLNESSE